MEAEFRNESQDGREAKMVVSFRFDGVESQGWEPTGQLGTRRGWRMDLHGEYDYVEEDSSHSFLVLSYLL